MNAVTTFKFEDPKGTLLGNVRVLDRDGEPWFVAKDVVEAVGAVWNGPQTIAHIPAEWKGQDQVLTLGGVQEMVVTSEQGVYLYLVRSDKPKAKPMQLWLAGEVIPSIRKTGSYSIPGGGSPATDASSLTSQALVLIAQAQQLHAQRLAAAESKLATVERKLSVWDADRQAGTFLGPLAVCKLLASGEDAVAELLFYCRRSSSAYDALKSWLCTEARNDKQPSMVAPDGGNESYLPTSCYNRGWLSAAVTYYASNVFKA